MGVSQKFFESKWCKGEIEAARDACIRVIPCFSGNHHGSHQVDKWVNEYRNDPVFGYIFKENFRDVLNKQNLRWVTRTLNHLADECRKNCEDLRAAKAGPVRENQTNEKPKVTEDMQPVSFAAA